jgi:fatty acid desaturase
LVSVDILVSFESVTSKPAYKIDLLPKFPFGHEKIPGAQNYDVRKLFILVSLFVCLFIFYILYNYLIIVYITVYLHVFACTLHAACFGWAAVDPTDDARRSIDRNPTDNIVLDGNYLFGKFFLIPQVELANTFLAGHREGTSRCTF